MSRTALDQGKFRSAPHTADVAIRLTAATREGLFRALLRALGRLYVGRRVLEPLESAPLQIDGPTLEDLLVRFANEIIYLVDARAMLPLALHDAALTTGSGGFSLTADLPLGSLAKDGAGVDVELKAATYHRIKIVERRGGGALSATMVIDI